MNARTKINNMRESGCDFKVPSELKTAKVRNLVQIFEKKFSENVQKFTHTTKYNRNGKLKINSQNLWEDKIICDKTRGSENYSKVIEEVLKSGRKQSTMYHVGGNADEEIVYQHVTELDFEYDDLPDVEDLVDASNTLIYLGLSEENGKHLNSYDSDFEESFDEDYLNVAESSNNVISFQFSPYELQIILHVEELISAEKIGELDYESIYEDDEEPISNPHKEDVETKRKISYILQELLTTEKSYVETLEKGILTYVNPSTNKTTPSNLHGKKYHIFGNIEFIYNFHKLQFLPNLSQCGMDAGKIGDLFQNCLDKDYFYGYVLFALYRPKSERLCNLFLDYFQQQQNQNSDKLGIKSFILQPIQRLPRYQLLLASISKILSLNTNDIVRERTLLKIIIAERRLTELITTMNQSMVLNDIVDCDFEDNDKIELGLGVLSSAKILNSQNNENQVLFLLPRGNDNIERNKPINLLHQGKFKHVSNLFINDKILGRQYHGKVFIFERCIIFTESISSKVLEYRGHYTHHEIGMNFNNKQILKLYSLEPGNLAIDIKENIEHREYNLKSVAELIENIINARGVVQRRIGNKTSTSRRSSFRSSISSNISDISYRSSMDSSILNSSCNISATEGSSSDEEKGNASIESFLNYHQYYLETFEENFEHYVKVLPDEVKQHMLEFIVICEKILQLQYNVNNFINKNDNFCDIFHDNLKEGRYEIYFSFVREFKHVEMKLMSFEHYMTAKQSDLQNCILSIEDFLYLPLKYINSCHCFFESYSDDFLRKEFKAFNRKLHENYKIRMKILDLQLMNEMGSVKYSDTIQLDTSYAKYRIFLMETGVLCLRIKSEKETKNGLENYSNVVFYSPYIMAEIKDSKKDKKRLNVFLKKQKTSIIFTSEVHKLEFCDKLAKFSSPSCRLSINNKKNSVFYSH